MWRSARNSKRNDGLGKTAVFVVLVAYLLRAFVPAGWMPAAMAGEAGNYIFICTVSGLKTIAVDSDGMPLDEEAPHGLDHDGKLCTFGVASKLALASPDIRAGLPSNVYILHAPIAARFVPAAVGLHSSYSPRAPPVFI
jgi:hypothetical protein